MSKSRFSRLQYTFLLNNISQMAEDYYSPMDVNELHLRVEEDYKIYVMRGEKVA